MSVEANDQAPSAAAIHRSRNCQQPAPSFTLIELLVVVAIIAILAALLLPVLRQAKFKAKQAQCASQLHQIGIAAISIAQDNSDTFPSACQASINSLYNCSRDAFDKVFQGKGNVFYCPSEPWDNPWEWTTNIVAGTIQIGYYWLANPNNSPCANPLDTYYLDTNGDGLKRDEYLVTLKDPKPEQIAICVDQTGTPAPPYPQSWWFVHGDNALRGRG